MATLKSILFVLGAIIVLIAIAGAAMMAFHVLSMCVKDAESEHLVDVDTDVDVDIPETAEEYQIGGEEPYDVIKLDPANDTRIGSESPVILDDGQDADGNSMTNVEPQVKPQSKKNRGRKKKVVESPAK